MWLPKSKEVCITPSPVLCQGHQNDFLISSINKNNRMLSDVYYLLKSPDFVESNEIFSSNEVIEDKIYYLVYQLSI